MQRQYYIVDKNDHPHKLSSKLFKHIHASDKRAHHSSAKNSKQKTLRTHRQPK